MIYEDEVLILKEIKYKENDKILHAISRNHGKMQIIARGCRKNNSPYVNVAQIASYSKCQLYKNKDMYILEGAELIDNFYNIRCNITAFLHCTYVLEVMNYVSHENEVEPRVFDMTLKLLSVLDKVKDDCITIENIVAAFELKLVTMLGYRPMLDNCVVCGKPITTNSFFRIEDGGIYCSQCIVNTHNCINIEYNEIITLHMMLHSKLENIYQIKDINDKLKLLIRKYMFFNIGKSNFITLKLLEKGTIYG